MTARRLTATQIRILQNLADGLPATTGAYGLSGHGGWAWSLRSLYRAGLVQWEQRTKNGATTYHEVLTEAGRTALDAAKGLTP